MREPLDAVLRHISPALWPPGHRRLTHGERYRAGDLFRDCVPDGTRSWRAVDENRIGEEHLETTVAYRKVRLQAPTFRYLDAGERVRIGDEWLHPSGRWRQVTAAVGARAARDDRMRRALRTHARGDGSSAPADPYAAHRLRLAELGVEEVD